MKLKNIQECIAVKFFLLLVTLILGAASIFFIFHAIPFLEKYSPSETVFTQTDPFLSLYKQYLDRAAVYTKYREAGYLPDPSSFYSKADLISMFNGKANGNLIPSDDVYNMSQESFEYYNYILNQNNPDFFYYALNQTTNTFYYNETMSDFIRKTQNIPKQTPITSEILDDFFESYVKVNCPYLILDTSYRMYYTNLSGQNYSITENTVSFALRYLTLDNSSNQIELEELSEKTMTEKITNPSNYLLYTGYLKTESETNSVFAELEKEFELNYNSYQQMLHFLPWIVGGLILVLSFSIIVIGHKKGVNGIYHSKFDKIFYEILLLGICLLAFLVICSVSFLKEEIKVDNIFVWVGLFYLISFWALSAFFITTIRRFKSHIWFESFLCLKICRFLFQSFYHISLYIKHTISKFFHDTKKLFRNFFLERSTVVLVFATLFIFCCYTIFSLLIAFESPFIGLCLLFLGFIILGLYLLRAAGDLNVLRQVTRRITAGDINTKAPSQKSLLFRELTENINHIGNGLAASVEKELKSERMKTELITNVSHDIKTPLTSIINYVDLLKKIDLKDETAKSYLAVLEEKSWRLKTLIEDLVEASKASSGTLSIQLQRLNLCELVKQACGEFEDRLTEQNLQLILSLPKERGEELPVIADGRSTYRIIENLLSNVNKYAMPGTRVYVEAFCNSTNALLSIKNISAAPLNISSEELMERFVRGDRSRNTEGSGLGLSIAKSLAELQHGSFKLYLDGDLFKAVVTLPLYLEDT